jgi:hypothetical protein
MGWPGERAPLTFERLQFFCEEVSRPDRHAISGAAFHHVSIGQVRRCKDVEQCPDITYRRRAFVHAPAVVVIARCHKTFDAHHGIRRQLIHGLSQLNAGQAAQKCRLIAAARGNRG